MTIIRMNKNWFIFYVQSGKEIFLRDMINSRGDLEAFIPMMERKYKIKGVFQIIVKPMFPGYIFLKTNENQSFIEQLFQEYRMKLKGFKKLLKHDEEGTIVLYQEEIRFLDEILDEECILRMSRGVIRNNIIIIEEGPLKGLEKNIKKIDRHTCLAKLYVQILHKEVITGLEITSKNEYSGN